MAIRRFVVATCYMDVAPESDARSHPARRSVHCQGYVTPASSADTISKLCIPTGRWRGWSDTSARAVGTGRHATTTRRTSSTAANTAGRPARCAIPAFLRRGILRKSWAGRVWLRHCQGVCTYSRSLHRVGGRHMTIQLLPTISQNIKVSCTASAALKKACCRLCM